MLRRMMMAGGSGGGGGGDPSFASVASLLHFDGADGSSTFTDVKGLAWTRTNNPLISTDQSKFGGASGEFGNADALSVASSAFAIGSSVSFTVELWVRPNVVNTLQGLWGLHSAGTSFYQYIDSTGRIVSVVLGSVGSAAGPLVANTWAHVALCRDGGTCRVFIDGVQVGSQSRTSAITGSPQLVLGANAAVTGATAGLRGFMDDFRFTPGVARYTANFTPPTSAFPDS